MTRIQTTTESAGTVAAIRRKALLALPCFCFTVLAALAPSAMAQITSTIEGTVRDAQSAVVSGAVVTVRNVELGAETNGKTESNGFYRIPGLSSGTYTLTVSFAGFASRTLEGLQVTLNRTLTLDVTLEVAGSEQKITVEAQAPLIDPTTSATGSTVVQNEIRDLPLNGRNYLDLMGLVPGVGINPQASGDTATSVLGERGGNAIFLIDGLSNRNEVSGGPGATFDQDTILEFQVLTGSYKAEFGHGSGGAINVVTKSGTNRWHGTASLFARNDALDSSNTSITRVPFLHRWDYDATVGGPVIHDRVFFFGSQERIDESRRLNFVFQPQTPQVLQDFENQFSHPATDFETRTFGKFDEQLGRHRLTQQLNVDKAVGHGQGSVGDLPSTRRNSDSTHSVLAFRDSVLLSNRSILALYGQYRVEPSTNSAAHPEAGPGTELNLFSSLDTNRVAGDFPYVEYGVGTSASYLTQKYTSLGASLARFGGKHALKFGWDYQRMNVDGIYPNSVFNQVFATVSDFQTFGPIDSGFFTLRTTGGLTPEDSRIRLRNNYNGLYTQDDWKVRPNLTINLGLRWDYDGEFPSKRNISPRLGVAWSVRPKTVVRASWGIFYDHFRLGLAEEVPAFGGANIQTVQPLSYPRLFYGVPTIAPILVGLCLSPDKTDAQLAATGATCQNGPFPLIGVDRLNRVAAPGHAAIPDNAVVNVNNIQQLSGLTPQQYADAASKAIGQNPGFFFWGPYGALSETLVSPSNVPVQIDSRFRTPYTRGFNVGVEHEIARDFVVNVDYFHRDINNMLGQRETNLEFISRIPGHSRTYAPPDTKFQVETYGPWFGGTYDALIVTFTRRFSRRFSFGATYTFAHQTDDLRCANLGECGPADAFVGVPPVVTDPKTGQTNANGPFVASNGNPVPQAGKFYNGPNFDHGPSDLSVDQAVFAYGTVALPLRIEVSGILRAQSGFHFSRQSETVLDYDGSLSGKPIDYVAGRNAFTAPPYVNTDIRLARTFKIGERITVRPTLEFFNLFNARNPAAVEIVVGTPTPFGQATQVLPGREGQLGVRIQF